MQYIISNTVFDYSGALCLAILRLKNAANSEAANLEANFIIIVKSKKTNLSEVDFFFAIFQLL